MLAHGKIAMVAGLKRRRGVSVLALQFYMARRALARHRRAKAYRDQTGMRKRKIDVGRRDHVTGDHEGRRESVAFI